MNKYHRYWIAFYTIIEKEILRFVRIWIQTILPAAVTTALYFIIFGTLIGNRIGEMDGHNYIDFIVPGLILMAVITNSYSNVVSSFFSSKMQRHIEELLISPVPNWIIIVGYVGGGVARGIMVGIAVTLVALLFTDLVIHSYSVTFAVVIYTSILFSLAGLINAVFAKTFDDISIVPTFVLTPLTYLGGVFYSIKMLPEFWQQLSLVNPILYMVNAFRYGLLGSSDIPIGTALVIILLFIMVLGAVCHYLLARGVGIKD